MLCDAAREVIANTLQQKIASLRCTVHGRGPTLSHGKKAAAGFEMQIDACCDALVKRAEQRLRAS